MTVLLLSFVRTLTNTYAWWLWPAIRRARREIREVARKRIPGADVFSHQGATAINPAYLAFCVTTTTDKERDLLSHDTEIYREFCDALKRAGYPEDAIPRVHFGIESQETVDRDYGGRWRERIEMP